MVCSNCVRCKIWRDIQKTKTRQKKMVPISLIVLFVWISKFILVKADSNEVFNQCIRSPKPNVMRCIGQQTLSSLIMLDKMDNFTIVNGLEMIRPDDGQQRTLTELFVEDPMDFRLVWRSKIHLEKSTNVSDFRGLLENAGTLVGQRSLQWDLSMIEPGLLLRVGPTSDQNSVLEFVMDPHHDRGDRYHVEDPSTGKTFILSNHQRKASRIQYKQAISHILHIFIARDTWIEIRFCNKN